MKDPHSKIVGENDYTDSESIACIEGIITKHRRFRSELKSNDKTPVTDGHITITNEDKETIGRLTVQVKTLPAGSNLSYDLDVSVFSEVERVDSIMLLAVDNQNEKVYWKLIDQEYVASQKWKGQKTKKVYLNKDACLSKQDSSYIAEWVKVIEERRKKTAKLSKIVTDSFNDTIAEVKSLFKHNRYDEALSLVLKLEKSQWDDADTELKFQILTNKGIAYQGINKLSKAIESLSAANKLLPENPKSKPNSIAVELLKKDYKKAKELAEKLILEMPDDEHVAVGYIQALRQNKVSIEKIIKNLKKSVLSSPEVLHVLAQAYLENDDVDLAIETLKSASQASDDVSILNNLALLMIQRVGERDQGKVKTAFDIEERKELQVALGYLEKNWNLLISEVDKNRHSYMLYNMALAHKMLGNESEYDCNLQEALKRDPDNEIYLQQYAISSITNKDNVQDAKNRLVKVTLKDKSDIVTDTLFVTLLHANKDYTEALKAIKKFKELHREYDKYLQDIISQEADILVKTDQIKRFDTLIASLESNNQTELLSTIIQVKKLIAENQLEEATAKTKIFYSEKYHHGNDQLDLDFADVAYELKLHDVAADVYSKTIIPNSINDFTRRLLVSLYYSKKYERVISIIDSISKYNDVNHDIAQFYWLSLLSLDRIAEAIEYLEELLENKPNESARFELISLKFREGDINSLKKYAASKIDYYKLDLNESLRLASLLSIAGKVKRTLDVIYLTRRRFPNESQAHSGYVTQFLNLGDKRTKPYATVSEVTKNSVIFFNSDKFIIESEYDPKYDLDEISLDLAIQRGYIGKKIGDEIVIASNPISGETKATIKNIKTKYIHALHESMEKYETRFMGETDLMKIPISSDGSFKELKEMLTKNYENSRSAEEMYKSKQLTIELFAAMLSKNAIEITYGLMASNEIGLIASDGTTDELEEANSVLETFDSDEIVLDLTSILVLNEIGFEVKDVGISEFLIAASVRDKIIQFVENARVSSNQKVVTLSKNETNYIRSEDTKERSRSKYEHAEELLKWVQRNTKTAAITDKQIQDFESIPEIVSLNEGVEQYQLDTLRLLMQPERLFICDDILLRKLTEQIMNTNPSWSLVYINYMFSIRRLEVYRFLDLILNLAKINYRHTGVSPLLLFETAEKSNWDYSGDLELVVKTLALPAVDIVSMMSVFMQFALLAVNQNKINQLEKIIPALINELSKSRNLDQVQGIYKDTVSNLLKNDQDIKTRLLNALN